MKLFLFEFAHDRKYGAFTDQEDAYENRATVDPMYEWTPVDITEVTVDGFDIALTPSSGELVGAAPAKRGRKAAAV